MSNFIEEFRKLYFSRSIEMSTLIIVMLIIGVIVGYLLKSCDSCKKCEECGTGPSSDIIETHYMNGILAFETINSTEEDINTSTQCAINKLTTNRDREVFSIKQQLFFTYFSIYVLGIEVGTKTDQELKDLVSTASDDIITKYIDNKTYTGSTLLFKPIFDDCMRDVLLKGINTSTVQSLKIEGFRKMRIQQLRY